MTGGYKVANENEANIEEIKILRERVRNLEEGFDVLLTATRELMEMNDGEEKRITLMNLKKFQRVYVQYVKGLRGDEGGRPTTLDVPGRKSHD